MSNLTQSTQVKQVSTSIGGMQVPIKSGSKIYMGAMVCLLTASGYAVRAGTASTGPVQGVAQAEAAQPSADGGSNVNLLAGIFAFALNGTHTPTIANVGKVVYASDDNTISSLSSDGPIAGILVGFEASSGKALVYINPATNAAIAQEGIPATAVTGALSTVADAPAKAVLTSIISALVAHGIATDGTT